MDDSGVYDISNLDRLGKSEWQLVQNVVDGVKISIDLEKALENQEDIDCYKVFEKLNSFTFLLFCK